MSRLAPSTQQPSYGTQQSSSAATTTGSAPGRNLYLAGPMTGLPHFNRPAFDLAAAKLRANGWHVFSPVEYDIEQYGEGMFEDAFGNAEYAAERYGYDRREVLAADLDWICLEADAIMMLDGWMRSTGARAEYATAVALGLRTYSEMEIDWCIPNTK